MEEAMESSYELGPSSEEQSEEEQLRPLLDILNYLQRRVEELHSDLQWYSQDLCHKEQYSLAVPTLIRVSQPFLLYLESTARGRHHESTALPENLQRRLLDFSQQLVSQLELLSLIYGSFGFISLDETDPEGYFMCYQEVDLDVSHGLLSPDHPHMQKLWSIGLWVPLEPANDADVLSWVLCSQPSGLYHQLLKVGFNEPSHTAATDLLVTILTNKSAVDMTPTDNTPIQPD
ncbi:UPF0575 protein C19orf67 homolog [Rhinophrynus dorsalis]